jgi:hypothetical protein
MFLDVILICSGCSSDHVTDTEQLLKNHMRTPTRAQFIIETVHTIVTSISSSVPSNIPQDTIMLICSLVNSRFLEQPMLLELDAPISVCGKIAGQAEDLLKIFNEGRKPPRVKYLFLGGYANHGANGIDCLLLLFLYKILYPNDFYMLRGKHECHEISAIYGLYDECKFFLPVLTK